MSAVIPAAEGQGGDRLLEEQLALAIRQTEFFHVGRTGVFFSPGALARSMPRDAFANDRRCSPRSVRDTVRRPAGTSIWM
jgi:hypothetical protein